MGQGGSGTEEDAFRVRFPEAEEQELWLPLLLDAYAVLDAGLERAVAASGRRPACRAGCQACCHQPIPASSLEVLGLTWYVIAQCRGLSRRLLRRQLRDGGSGPACPFLVEGQCAGYALRPMACREFVVFGRTCCLGEEPHRTRPGDMLPLPAAAQREAFRRMLPYYGLTDPDLCEAALHDRLILRDTALLQGRDWGWLARCLI